MPADIAAFIVWMAAGLYGMQAFFGFTKRDSEKGWPQAACIMAFLCVTVGFFALIHAFSVSDFNWRMVAEYSHQAKPRFFKIAGAWGNHEGSMLLFIWLLAVAGIVLIATRASRVTLGVHGVLTLAFSLMLLLTASPFEVLLLPPLEGLGLNPLLQDVALAIHPPLLYLGYVGFALPFCSVTAALIGGKIDRRWAERELQFVRPAWAFLTIGIALGSWWAYRELGWGGFWFWDPVENASLLPWLSGTALLHALIVYHKRGLQQRWTVLLTILTFGFSLLGFFLVRSGVLTSVHAFASDPARGLGILMILTFAVGVPLLLYGKRAAAWKAAPVKFHYFSRETLLFINTIVLMVLLFTVALGTLYPLVMQWLGFALVAVGPDFFAQTVGPLSWFLLPAAALGGWLKWGKDAPRRVGVKALISVVAVLIALLLLLENTQPISSIFLLAVGLLLVFSVCADDKIGWRAKLPMWLAHAGLGIMAIAVASYAIGSVSKEVMLKIGDTETIADYRITLVSVTPVKGENYLAYRAELKVANETRQFYLHPERRLYPVEDQRTSEAAIDSGWFGDVYSVMSDPDLPSQRFHLRLYYRPAMRILWLGVMLMVVGGFAAFMMQWRRK